MITIESMEEEQPNNKSAAAGEADRISELPNEILHSVLRYIPCHKQIARTSLLSSRWRYLYGTYPFVEVSRTISMKSFQKFSEATLKRFSRDKLLRLESLKIAVETDKDCSRSQAAEQLLDLASKRKAEHVEVSSYYPSIILPLQLLSNSSLRFLSLYGFQLFSDKYDLILSLRTLHLNRVSSFDKRNFTNLIASCSPVLETLKIDCVCGMENVFMPNGPCSMNFSMKSLRFLHLKHVRCGGERGFLNLMANCPLLETLGLWYIGDLSKLQISNLPNLKTLRIIECDYLGVIEIAASELQTFQLLGGLGYSIKVELIAPQLNVLEMIHPGLSMVDIKAVVSKLQSLKSLAIDMKMELSGYKLEEFMLSLVDV